MASTRPHNIRKALLILFLAGAALVLGAALLLLANLDSLVRDASARAAAARGLRLETGVVKCSLLSGRVEARDLVLHNPPECAEDVLASCSKLSATVRVRDSIRQRRLHFAELELTIDEAAVEMRYDGSTNLDGLVGRGVLAVSGNSIPVGAVPCTASATGQPAGPAAEHPAAGPDNFPVIDRLVLHMGTLRVRDCTQEAPVETTIPFNFLGRTGANIDSRGKLRDFLIREFMPAIRDAIRERKREPGGAGFQETLPRFTPADTDTQP